MQRELVQIVGATGFGKSSRLREIIRDHRRIVALDPSADFREWRRIGFDRVNDLRPLSLAIQKNWRKGFRYVLVPRADLMAEALDGMCQILFGYQDFFYKKRGDGVSLVIDEMAECYSNSHQQRRDLCGMRRVILQGRHAGISVYGVTQRPQDVATQFRANCDRGCFFALHDASARDAVVSKIGREHEAVYRGLGPYEYLEWQGGRVRKAKTKKP